MHVEPWEWALLGVIVVGLIALDLLGHVRKAHEPTIAETARWTSFYVSLAILFGVLTLLQHSFQFATEYFAGYLTEYSLSLDNIFVFIIIVAAFRVPRIYQQKVLLYGIIIALILRLIFILIGAKLIEQFVWVFFVFGAWMLYTAIKQVLDGIHEGRKRKAHEHLDDEEYEPTAVTRLISRVANVTDGYVGDRLVVRRHGKTRGSSAHALYPQRRHDDLMFALDSIPAIFGHDPRTFHRLRRQCLCALRPASTLFPRGRAAFERLIYLHGLAVILASSPSSF